MNLWRDLPLGLQNWLISILYVFSIWWLIPS